MKRNLDDNGLKILTLILPAIDSKIKPIVVLDELHKAKLWKRSLKGLYDTQDGSYDILVTGSARLNVYRKGSDSLLGRYYHFRLHPFSVAELLKNHYSMMPDELISRLFSRHLMLISASSKKIP